MKQALKYIFVVLIISFLGYHSVYFKSLNEVINASAPKFDAQKYAAKLWAEKMPLKIDSAIDLANFIEAVTTNKEAAFQQYSNALGIGNYRYALVKTKGIVRAVNEDDLSVLVTMADSTMIVILATEYIYGNAIRDASALIDIKNFSNTEDLNSISQELNKIVRTSVLAPFKQMVKTGDEIDITAAVEINKEHIKWTNLELLPVYLKIVQ